MMRILIAPNSFKECADAVEITALFEENIKKILKEQNTGDFEIIGKPVSDGGDGFLEVFKSNFTSEEIIIELPDLTGRSVIKCPVLYSKELETVFVETAKIIGLNTVPADKRNPLKYNTGSIGILMKKIAGDEFAKSKRIREIVFGIGGTATNDLGIGVASEFGLQLFEAKNKELSPLPGKFIKAEKILFDHPAYPFKLKVIADVNNPLTGISGAATIYAPQKGADKDDIELLETGTKNILRLLKPDEIKISKLSGAGGGLAAGFELFFGAEIISSKDFILNYLGVNRKLKPEFVITGEGSFDSQSFFSKAASVIIDEFRTSSKILICAGKISDDCVNLNDKNIELFELNRLFNSKEESIKNIRSGIEKASGYFVNKILKSGVNK